MAQRSPAYRRILLKLSGEALLGSQQYGIDPPSFAASPAEICRSHRPRRPSRPRHRRRQHLSRRRARRSRHGPRHGRPDGHAGHRHQLTRDAGRARAPRRRRARACPRCRFTRSARTTFAAAPCATSRRAASRSSRPAPAIRSSRPTPPRACAPSRSAPTCSSRRRRSTASTRPIRSKIRRPTRYPHAVVRSSARGRPARHGCDRDRHVPREQSAARGVQLEQRPAIWCASSTGEAVGTSVTNHLPRTGTGK